jgi:hypothetical protein
MRKILHIVGDSLARARFERPETTPFLDTYTGRLMSELPEWHVVLQSRIGLNTSLLLSVGEREFLTGVTSDAFVLHLGINDCAPRALSTRELAWLQRLRVPLTSWSLAPKVQPLIRKHHYRLTRRRLWSDVPYDEFVRNLAKIRTTFPSRRHMFIPILPPTQRYRDYTHGIAEQGERYNAAMRAAGYEEIPLTLFDAERHTSTDLIHPTVEGHAIIARAIRGKLAGSAVELPADAAMQAAAIGGRSLS